METEAKARVRIDGLLKRAWWRFFDDEKGPANIALEANVKIKKNEIDQFGDDFEKTVDGFVDYLLLDTKGFPCAVLEAKSEKIDPLAGKEQARKYARSLNVRFVILSNGNLHYFWDLEQGNPSIITEFPSQESLDQYQAFKPNPDNLVKEKVEAHYMAITQDPMYKSAPRWNNPDERDAFIKENNLKFLRHYQLKAIHALQKSVTLCLY
ncbi:MAG: type I restriction enzyme HsdR N-terminal domain-containing protein [Desulfobacterales bacterium]|nr:type I restriction enzyme HsdR N-terminal domain-containing protein [Desulfobacterales bacterium]